jgi:hypothetical protein
MSIKIEFRYAVLTSLAVLLWLIIEYAVGLQDTYVALHPYVSIIMGALIPIATYRLAFIEKIEDNFGKVTYWQLFFSGLLITVFACILAIPVQLGFHKLINPDFFETMILYTSVHSRQTIEQAAAYFNLKSYIGESVLFAFVTGSIVSLILAFRMRTVK